MRRAAVRAPARAGALVAALALAGGAPTRVLEPAECREPRVVAHDSSGLAQVRCEGTAGAPLAGAERLLFGLPLELNRADAASLEALPGIGPARAAAIAREAAARPFCAVAELDRVPGIGPATLAGLAALVRATPAERCAP